jgi:hypothetical protein
MRSVSLSLPFLHLAPDQGDCIGMRSASLSLPVFHLAPDRREWITGSMRSSSLSLPFLHLAPDQGDWISMRSASLSFPFLHLAPDQGDWISMRSASLSTPFCIFHSVCEGSLFRAGRHDNKEKQRHFDFDLWIPIQIQLLYIENPKIDHPYYLQMRRVGKNLLFVQ